MFSDIRLQYDVRMNELTKKTSELNSLTHSLQLLEDSLMEMENSKDEQKHLVEMYAANKKTLRSQAETLLDVVIKGSEDTQKLHDKLDRKA